MSIVTIFLVDYDGSQMRMSANPNHTIHHLKQAMEVRRSVSPPFQAISFQGTMLPDSTTLASAGIGDGAVLQWRVLSSSSDCLDSHIAFLHEGDPTVVRPEAILSFQCDAEVIIPSHVSGLVSCRLEAERSSGTGTRVWINIHGRTILDHLLKVITWRPTKPLPDGASCTITLSGQRLHLRNQTRVCMDYVLNFRVSDQSISPSSSSTSTSSPSPSTLTFSTSSSSISTLTSSTSTSSLSASSFPIISSPQTSPPHVTHPERATLPSASLPTMALPTIHRSGMPVQILPSIYSLSASSGRILPSPHEFFNSSGQLPSPVGLSHPTMPFAYARPSQPPLEAPLRQQLPITVRCSANAMVVDIPILKPISFQELLLLICSVHLLNRNLIDKLFLWRFQNQQWVSMLLSTDADVGWLQDQDVIEVILYSSDLMAKRASDEMSSGSSHMDYDAKRQRT